MSFLDSVLSSIETGKPSPIPPTSTLPTPPVSVSSAKPLARRPTDVPRDRAPERKPIAAGTKRKAEEQLAPPAKPVPPAPARTTATTTTTMRPTVPTAPRPRPNAPSTSTTATIKSRSSTPQKAPPVSSKPPPKGSFADLMAKAKQLQQKAPSQVGMFKHQAAPKEKVSKVDRKKKAAETSQKEKDARSAKKPGVATGSAGPVDAAARSKSGDGKVVKKRETEPLSYKGTARPTTTPSSSQNEYRGTSGLPPRKTPADRKAQSRASKRSRLDEYLGTDEEDEGEYADDYDDYFSESSDMEAGLDAMEEEEAAALAAARREDEEEWRAELAAKQQKLDRRKKLTALAARR